MSEVSCIQTDDGEWHATPKKEPGEAPGTLPYVALETDCGIKFDESQTVMWREPTCFTCIRALGWFRQGQEFEEDPFDPERLKDA
jgi:hypothetical protein